MGHEEHKEHVRWGIRCAVLTISDSRTKENDDSGEVIKEFLERNKHKVIFYDILRDERKDLEMTMNRLVSDPEIDAIITNGGTGVSKRDITIEVVNEFIEKELVGFGEIFRYLSYTEIGTPAIMSRALAGVCNDKVIISLPGSVNAVTLGMEKMIIPELGHIVWEVNK